MGSAVDQVHSENCANYNCDGDSEYDANVGERPLGPLKRDYSADDSDMNTVMYDSHRNLSRLNNSNIDVPCVGSGCGHQNTSADVIDRNEGTPGDGGGEDVYLTPPQTAGKEKLPVLEKSIGKTLKKSASLEIDNHPIGSCSSLESEDSKYDSTIVDKTLSSFYSPTVTRDVSDVSKKLFDMNVDQEMQSSEENLSTALPVLENRSTRRSLFTELQGDSIEGLDELEKEQLKQAMALSLQDNKECDRIQMQGPSSGSVQSSIVSLNPDIIGGNNDVQMDLGMREWACSKCTYTNQILTGSLALICDMCMLPRSQFGELASGGEGGAAESQKEIDEKCDSVQNKRNKFAEGSDRETRGSVCYPNHTKGSLLGANVDEVEVMDFLNDMEREMHVDMDMDMEMDMGMTRIMDMELDIKRRMDGDDINQERRRIHMQMDMDMGMGMDVKSNSNPRSCQGKLEGGSHRERIVTNTTCGKLDGRRDAGGDSDPVIPGTALLATVDTSEKSSVEMGKNSKPVKVSEGKDVVDSALLYRLTAVLRHLGSGPMGGHYICDVRRSDTTTSDQKGLEASPWLRCNDTLVTAIGEVSASRHGLLGRE